MSLRTLLPILCLAAACGPTGKRPAAPAPVAPATPTPTGDRASTEVELEPLRIKVVRDATGGERLDAYDARALLDRGNRELTEGRFRQALVIYDQLVGEFPDSVLIPLAEYNAGQAFEGLAEWDRAIERYRRVITAAPGSRDSVDAHIRIGVIFTERKRWGQAAELFEELLARTDLSPGDRIEGMARLGYVLIEQRDYPRAEAVLTEAVEYYSKVSRTEELETNYFVAMAYYYLANVPHRQGLEVPLRITSTTDEDLQRDLSAKVELLELAYDRYLIALRRRHPYWATAAGYQMSQMFKDFWNAVITAPTPRDLTAEEAGFYRRALHKYMRSFLTKAMLGHGQNVELAEAYRTSTEWSRASEEQAERIAEILAREAAGDLVVPDEGAAMREPARDAGGRGGSYMPGRYEL